MFLGKSWRQNICIISRSPVSAAERSSDRGTKCTFLEKRATTARMVVLPPERGRSIKKIHRNVWPGTMGNREKIEETGWRTVQRFPTSTNRTDSDKGPSVLLHGRPPKPLLQKAKGQGQTKVASQLGECPHWRREWADSKQPVVSWLSRTNCELRTLSSKNRRLLRQIRREAE